MVAPDYPGFGHSDAPSADSFSYMFEHIADYIERFTDEMSLDRYALVVQDCQVASKRPCIARCQICARIGMRHKAFGSDSLLSTKSRIVLATKTGSSTMGTCPTPGRNLSSASGTARSIGTP